MRESVVKYMSQLFRGTLNRKYRASILHRNVLYNVGSQ